MITNESLFVGEGFLGGYYVRLLPSDRSMDQILVERSDHGVVST